MKYYKSISIAIVVLMSGCTIPVYSDKPVYKIENNDGNTCIYYIGKSGTWPEQEIVAPCGIYAIGDTFKVKK